METELICPTCAHGPMVLVSPDWDMTGQRKRGVVRVDEHMKPTDEHRRCIACAEEGRVPYKLTPPMTPEERAVLEAAEKWHAAKLPPMTDDKFDQERLSREYRVAAEMLQIAVARMLKARGGA